MACSLHALASGWNGITLVRVYHQLSCSPCAQQLCMPREQLKGVFNTTWAGHYTRTAPSEDYVNVWRELEIHSNPIIVSSAAARKACTTDFFTVVRNGVLFPIWRMRDCVHNDSGGGTGPFQNTAESLKMVWHTVTHPREEGTSVDSGPPLLGLQLEPKPAAPGAAPVVAPHGKAKVSHRGPLHMISSVDGHLGRL